MDVDGFRSERNQVEWEEASFFGYSTTQEQF